MCPYVRNTRYMVLFMYDLYRPETRENPINGCEQAERASRNWFALLRQKHMFFVIQTR